MEIKPIYLAIVVGVVVMLAYFSWCALKMKLGELRVKRARKHGLEVEKYAPDVLRKMGFRDIVEQPVYNYSMNIGGQNVEVELNPDIIAKRHGRTYIIDIKTGGVGMVDNAKTRRQLLEYYTYIPADGVMMLNMDTKELHEYDFPYTKARSAKNNAILKAVMGLSLSVSAFAAILMPNNQFAIQIACGLFGLLSAICIISIIVNERKSSAN